MQCCNISKIQMPLVNGWGPSTQRSTCWACSLDLTSSDGNVFMLFLLLLMLLLQGIRQLRPTEGADACCPHCLDLGLSGVSLTIFCHELNIKSVVVGFLSFGHQCHHQWNNFVWSQGASLQCSHLRSPSVHHRYGRHWLLHGLLRPCGRACGIQGGWWAWSWGSAAHNDIFSVHNVGWNRHWNPVCHRRGCPGGGGLFDQVFVSND